MALQQQWKHCELPPPTISFRYPHTLSLPRGSAPPPDRKRSRVVQRPAAGAFELAECCRELEEGHRAWVAHKKEVAWRLRRMELQLEAEKACRRREKMEEIEAKVRALREEQTAALERIDAEYKEQLLVLRRDADAKEQKLAEQWAAKHARLSMLLEHIGSCRR
ncbi:hypothetical protein HPP92_006615 [Vanilla planifolia]|uniref:Transcription factor AS1 n=1 Tax=Vanilla planifolia TaxID=51239 RepID=A0A835RB46_VANPL|nr:hypothetical protein HPP92_006615 [Vanilla planifolia]